jgi:hypothetical protein
MFEGVSMGNACLPPLPSTTSWLRIPSPDPSISRCEIRRFAPGLSLQLRGKQRALKGTRGKRSLTPLLHVRDHWLRLHRCNHHCREVGRCHQQRMAILDVFPLPLAPRQTITRHFPLRVAARGLRNTGRTATATLSDISTVYCLLLTPCPPPESTDARSIGRSARSSRVEA